MKSSDAIIIGAGIMGLSLAIELRKKGLHVLILERGEPGREASYAAAGMLADSGDEVPKLLKPLAQESARMYPEFVHELEDESGLKVDLRHQGTILISCNGEVPEISELLSPERLKSIEPEVQLPSIRPTGSGTSSQDLVAAYLRERSVDPRALVSAAYKAARHREVDLSSAVHVQSLVIEGGRVVGVQADKARYSAPLVINCAGAWAGTVAPCEFPIRPIKGQMLAMVEAPALQHVVRSPRVYLVPRSDGRLVIGSTLEDVGYRKDTDVNTLQRFFEAAVELVPGIAKSRRHEAWAGLRPATPDELPILGETSVSGYFVAAGHYRDGILLAPVTANVMSNLVLGEAPRLDLSQFSPQRFAH
ncbi:MAG TPA: glycine oxidase ThiO [Terriglobales bacterium]|jgi:glycine oxidase|nr:glycine oxidase ThiO [Terriglobales bacterium]